MNINLKLGPCAEGCNADSQSQTLMSYQPHPSGPFAHVRTQQQADWEQMALLYTDVNVHGIAKQFGHAPV